MRAWPVSLIFVLWLSGNSVLAERWDTLYNQAIRDLEAGRYETAIPKLQEAIRQNPKSGAAIRADATSTVRYFPYFLLGKAYFHARKYEEAATFFGKENPSNLPDKLYASIVYYRQEIKSIQDRKRQEAFNGAVAAAEAARKEGALDEAAQQLEKARQADPAEFEKQGLEKHLAGIRDSKKQQQAAEAERQKTEAAFQALVKQAAEKEKPGALGEAADLLEKADHLIANRSEVAELRNRLEGRQSKFANAKQAASTAEQEGRLADGVAALKEAEQADPERYRAEKLTEWRDSLSRQLQIQQKLNAGNAALDQGQFAQAVENYNFVLQADPENVPAKTQKSRAQFLQLLSRGDELASQGSFADALQAFQLAESQNVEGGPQVYEKMRPHLDELSGSPIRSDWLEMMRNSDPDRFSQERLGGVTVLRRSPVVKASRPAGNLDSSVQRGVLAAIGGEPQEAVQILEKVKADGKTDNAELESWTGVAYARLAFLTADPKQRDALRAKATQHFRRALDLDPQHRLNSRLVPPRILKLYADAKR